MTDYQKIICAIALTGNENAIVSRAARIASKCNADLTMLHVLDPDDIEPQIAWGNPTWVHYSQFASLPEDAAIYKEAIEKAHDKMQQLGHAAGIRNNEHQVCVNRSVGDAVHQAASELNADLIIVGSMGSHGLMQLLSGSTADEVVDNAPCDVLAVRSGESGSE